MNTVANSTYKIFVASNRQVEVEIFQTDTRKSVLRNPGLPCGIYTLVMTTADGIDVRKKIVVE
ncbi:MAG: hypothetical protein QE487_18620 [Fluviicola sp.]|nr:hypothetical protein [Fluviicola sp.]